jgi:hypothetical protein
MSRHVRVRVEVRVRHVLPSHDHTARGSLASIGLGLELGVGLQG